MQNLVVFIVVIMMLLNKAHSVEVVKLRKSVHVFDNLTIGSEVFDLSRHLHETQLIDEYGYNSMSTVYYSKVFVEYEGRVLEDYFQVNSQSGVVSVSKRLDTVTDSACCHMYCNLQLVVQVETNSGLVFKYVIRVYVHTVSGYRIKIERDVFDFDVDEEKAPVVLLVGKPVNYTGCLKLQYELEIVNMLESRHDDWVVENDVDELKQLLDIQLVNDGRELFLHINEPIDRELFEMLELKISVKDANGVDGVESILSTIRIRLKIKDLNDNAPVFDRSNVRLNINEDVTRMTRLLEIKAIDRDSGLNGQLSYKLLNDSKFFYLNAKTGALFLIKSLNYENRLERSFELTVQAQDSSEDENDRRSSTCLLIISVLDVNDNAPVIHISPVAHANALASSYVHDVTVNFDKNVRTENQYQFVYLTLMAPFDTLIANIRIKDADSSFNGYIDSCVLSVNETTSDEENSLHVLPVYLYDKMNDSEYFSEKLYELRTNMVFNHRFNKTDKYLVFSIVMQAFDAGRDKQLSSVIYLQLIVINTNYEGINLLAYTSYSSFYEFNYKIHITENNQVPVLVSSLNMDKLRSLTNSSRMQFTKFRPNGNGRSGFCNELLLPYLQINPHNGDIVLNKRLDRELCPQYDFLLDYFKLNLTINLSIYVEDVNDNSPHFHKKEYRVLVNKTNLEKRYILKLTADDDDLNAKTVYRLEDHCNASVLSLNEFSGELRLKNPDDPKTGNLNVTVRAIDADNPDFLDAAFVFIHFEESPEATNDERKSDKSIFKTKSFKFIVVLISILIILLFIVLIIIYYLINDTSSVNNTHAAKRSGVNEIVINRNFKLVIDRDMSDLFETSTFNRTAMNSENVSQDSKAGVTNDTNGIQKNHSISISMNTLAIPRNESAIYDQKSSKKAVFDLVSESDT